MNRVVISSMAMAHAVMTTGEDKPFENNNDTQIY